MSAPPARTVAQNTRRVSMRIFAGFILIVEAESSRAGRRDRLETFRKLLHNALSFSPLPIYYKRNSMRFIENKLLRGSHVEY